MQKYGDIIWSRTLETNKSCSMQKTDEKKTYHTKKKSTLECFWKRRIQKQLIVENDTILKSGKNGHFANAIVRSKMASFGTENKTAKNKQKRI